MPNKLYKWLILIGLLAYAVLVSAWAGSHVRGLYCTGIDVDILPAAEGAHNFLKPEAVLNELGALAHDYGSPLTGSTTLNTWKWYAPLPASCS